MTTKFTNTRKFVSADIVTDLNRIERELRHEANQISDLIEAIQNWSAKAPEDQYDGEIAERIYDLLNITNNSGWISALQSAIRTASQRKGNY